MGTAPTSPVGRFAQAVAVSGHMIDAPDRAEPRFPRSREPAVAGEIRDVFDSWDVGPGALVVSGGARGTDIIAAEQAIVRGAEVWLLIALPEPRFVDESVRLDDDDWESRYRALRERCLTWFQPDELGPPPTDDVAFERHNGWCLDVVTAQGPPGRQRAVVIWDGREGDGPGGTKDFLDRARARHIEVAVLQGWARPT